MGVPQKRHRAVFIGIRSDLLVDPKYLDMSFNYSPVFYGEIKSGEGKRLSEKTMAVMKEVQQGEKDMVSAWNRVHNKNKPEKRMWFNNIIMYDDDVVQTIAGDHGKYFDYSLKTMVSDRSVANASTFPQDYDFLDQRIPYICGMAVPPIMMKRIVTRLIDQGVFDYKKMEEQA